MFCWCEWGISLWKTSISEFWCRHKKSLFLPSALIWRKTRKRKPWTLSFIEEDWICRTGNFSAFFGQTAGGKREATEKSESCARRGLQKRKQHLYPMHTKIEMPRKTFWEYWIANGVTIRILIHRKNVRITETNKRNLVSGPFHFF